jgi:hypothetical protein
MLTVLLGPLKVTNGTMEASLAHSAGGRPVTSDMFDSNIQYDTPLDQPVFVVVVVVKNICNY